MSDINKVEYGDRRSDHIPKKIGLALGSGAARGWAHIGVIESLIEHGHEITCIAGTSMGALVGAIYAAGKLDTLAKVAGDLDWQQVLYHFFDISFPRSGLIDGTKIASFIRQHVKMRDIRDLAVPFRAIATDLLTGQEVILDKGDVIEAIRASIATPGIFTPVKREGRVLVDGGLVNPVPVNAARAIGADFVLAVDVNHPLARKVNGGSRSCHSQTDQTMKADTASDLAGKIITGLKRSIDKLDESARAYARQFKKDNIMPNIFDVLGCSVRIMEAQIGDARMKIDKPDRLIRPIVGHLGFMDFHHAKEAISEGRKAMDLELQRQR